MKQQSPKSTLLADNTQGLITTKQTKPLPVVSATPHPIVKMDLDEPERLKIQSTLKSRKKKAIPIQKEVCTMIEQFS